MRYSDAIHRREFLRSTSVSVLSAASAAFPSIVRADTKSASSPVRVAVIGTQHAHAEGKIEEFLKLTNDFELVGVVEPDLSRRVRLEESPELRGMRWIEEATALKTPNVKCVARFDRRDTSPAPLLWNAVNMFRRTWKLDGVR